MSIGKPARLAFAIAALACVATPSLAQKLSGDGFLFATPKASLTFHAGVAQPLARSDLFEFTTSELTLGRSDFLSGNFGVDLTVAVAPRADLVLGFARSKSRARSEFRYWVDNNDQPIEQTTTFKLIPVTASIRYYLADRGRTVGSVAWIPARLVPFVGVGAGFLGYQFEQVGDFIDQGNLNVFRDKLTTRGWTSVFQGSAGAQWSLNQRFQLTGEVRYQRASGDASSPTGDFVGYDLDLSGVSTLLGITIRL